MVPYGLETDFPTNSSLGGTTFMGLSNFDTSDGATSTSFCCSVSLGFLGSESSFGSGSATMPGLQLTSATGLMATFATSTGFRESSNGNICANLCANARAQITLTRKQLRRIDDWTSVLTRPCQRKLPRVFRNVFPSFQAWMSPTRRKD